MKKIVLISCVSKKLDHKAKAEDLYESSLFKKNLAYARSLKADDIYILSAKHHVLKLTDEIEPYNVTLNNMKSKERKEWSTCVLNELKKVSDLGNDTFIFLAGVKYRQYLLSSITHYEIPMEGKKIGEQLHWLTRNQIKLKKNMSNKNQNMCEKVHELFNASKLKEYSYQFDENELPKNGIYIIFEKGETYKGYKRIVRVGTHTGDNQLRSRLKQHYVNENKDRSIFRKNIGRAFLNKDNDPFLTQWNIDLTTKENKEKYSSTIGFDKQKEVEDKVSDYLRNNTSFVVFEVTDKDQRLKFESRIISTISNCEDCKPSENWLGKYSPEDKIKKSGLWLVNELNKESLSEDEFEELKNIVLK